tara:strand:+ start:32 stop:253 length:222 start_codon:yes stop_codon:yes gene_type:complete
MQVPMSDIEGYSQKDLVIMFFCLKKLGTCFKMAFYDLGVFNTKNDLYSNKLNYYVVLFGKWICYKKLQARVSV